LRKTQSNLLQIALTTGSPRVLPRPRENRKQDGREDCYNSNYNQEFYKCERFFCLFPAIASMDDAHEDLRIYCLFPA